MTGRPGDPVTGHRRSSERPDLGDLIEAIRPVDPAVVEAHAAHQLRLTKPPGSLGRLETLAGRLAAIADEDQPPSPSPGAVILCAGDHGVHAEGVSPWPQAVTAQMVTNICHGGAAINAIAASVGLEVVAINVGAATPIEDHDRLVNDPIRPGTANIADGPAMTRSEAAAAIGRGAAIALHRVRAGDRCLITGEMGIANTTPSAAIVAAVTGRAAAEVTGRGTGVDDPTFDHKVTVVARAVARAADSTPTRSVSGRSGEPPVESGLGLLAELGGLEIGALAGVCLAGAASRVPVIVDGLIALAGALVAERLCPDVTGYLIAGHRSVEPGASVALDHLGLDPLLDLDLRLGEGTGAALAYPLVVAAARTATEMATFDDAAVSTADRPGEPVDGSRTG